MSEPSAYPTPVQDLSRIGLELNARVRVKRDDLLPEVGGGNKVRKLRAIFNQYVDQAIDAVVTTGGVDSNHCRVASILSAELGISCTLILHGDPSRPASNLRLMELMGARIRVVLPIDIASAMEEEIRTLRFRGLSVAYLRGGGHEPVGTLAYRDAVIEVAGQIGNPPSDIFVACGTGGTQAGLILGVHELGWPTRVIGVSVARQLKQAMLGVENAMADALNSKALPGRRNWTILDEFVGSGYGIPDPEADKWLVHAARTEGLVLDPTYTAKAFRGMVETRRFGDIGDDLLFWHTGGLLNLLSGLAETENQ